MDQYLNAKKQIIIITEKKESLSIMTQNPELMEEKNQLIQLKTQPWQSSNMGEAGWRIMTQKTAKHNHFNIEMVPIRPEENPHNPKGKLAKDNRRQLTERGNMMILSNKIKAKPK